MSRPWLGERAGWRDELIAVSGPARLERMNALARQADLRTLSGQLLCFVPQDALPAGQSYEVHVHQTGEVPTRTDGEAGLHDLYNALMWLVWPRSKAQVNALHACQGACETHATGRGTLRDTLTLLDESGLIWACGEDDLNQALRDFQWARLFQTHRTRVRDRVTARVFGHALLHKLERPYKAITAHAWVLHTTASDPATLDALLAQALRALPTLGDPTVPAASSPAQSGVKQRPAGAFCPLPVLGLPGWCAANESADFYRDEKIFRPGRSRHLQSASERVGRSLRVPAPGEEGPDSGGQGAG